VSVAILFCNLEDSSTLSRLLYAGLAVSFLLDVLALKWAF